MLSDLIGAVATYLHDVFIIQFSWWVALGFLAQAMFFMRFAVQWIASERVGRSVVPTSFWVFSILGGLLLFIYALQRKDPVFIAGQGLGLFNLRAQSIHPSRTPELRPRMTLSCSRHRRASPDCFYLNFSSVAASLPDTRNDVAHPKGD
jgi:lipid-A-disaccharide synthase-like uncharacterized protein